MKEEKEERKETRERKQSQRVETKPRSDPNPSKPTLESFRYGRPGIGKEEGVVSTGPEFCEA